MTQREHSPTYDEALARMQAAQHRLVTAMTQHLPVADRADAAEAARQLMHDMDMLYMVTFGKMIEQINSLQGERLADISGTQRALGDRQGRHAGMLADHAARLERVERLTARIATALELEP